MVQEAAQAVRRQHGIHHLATRAVGQHARLKTRHQRGGPSTGCRQCCWKGEVCGALPCPGLHCPPPRAAHLQARDSFACSRLEGLVLVKAHLGGPVRPSSGRQAVWSPFRAGVMPNGVMPAKRGKQGVARQGPARSCRCEATRVGGGSGGGRVCQYLYKTCRSDTA